MLNHMESIVIIFLLKGTNSRKPGHLSPFFILVKVQNRALDFICLLEEYYC